MTEDKSQSSRRSDPHMASLVQRNIQTLLERRKQEEQARSRQEKAAAYITRFTGSLTFVYIHLVGFGFWITVNLGWTPFRPFDPTFVVLAMFASVEAIFLSTFVLITQNRMQAQADRRADLDLQIGLLAEHEITQLLHITGDIAKKLGVGVAQEEELEELKRDVKPEKVLDEIIESEQQSNKQPNGSG